MSSLTLMTVLAHPDDESLPIDGELANVPDRAGAARLLALMRHAPTLQKQIKESAFMQKRSAGIPPTQIPESEQWELVNLIWDTPPDAIMTVSPVENYDWHEPAEIIRFAVCSGCGELVAEPYLRVVEGQPLCTDCSGYVV